MTIILSIAVLILIVLLLFSKKKFNKTIKDLQNILNSLLFKIKNLEQERENLRKRIELLEATTNSLKKYQGIVDTKQEVKFILFKANLEATGILENAINVLNNATTEATSIIEKAEIKATEIAMQNSKGLKKTAKAI